MLLDKTSFFSDRPFEFHELSKKFPLMNSKENRRLGKSIKYGGQHDDIVLFEKKILDGRNRYLACHMFKVTPRFRYFKDLETELEPEEWVIDKNYHRRHLNTAQQAEIALDVLRIERRKARERQLRTQFNKINPKEEVSSKFAVSDPGSRTVKDQKKGRAIDIVSKKYRMAPKSLLKAEKIKEAAKDDSEIQDLWERAKKNEVSLEEVYRTFKRKNDIEKDIKDSIKKRFFNAGANLKKKFTSKESTRINKKSTQKEINEGKSPSSDKQRGIKVCKSKIEQFKIIGQTEKKLCCYYCSFVSIKHCMDCEKHCSTLKCLNNNDIEFTSTCEDFLY